MRIDVVQSAPIPEIPKVAQGGGASTSYDKDFGREFRNVSETAEPQGASRQGGKSLEDKVDRINEKLRQAGKKIQFKIHRDPNRIITQIVDADTNEVIKEIPPEKMIEIADALDKAYGHSIDKKV